MLLDQAYSSKERARMKLLTMRLAHFETRASWIAQHHMRSVPQLLHRDWLRSKNHLNAPSCGYTTLITRSLNSSRFSTIMLFDGKGSVICRYANNEISLKPGRSIGGKFSSRVYPSFENTEIIVRICIRLISGVK